MIDYSSLLLLFLTGLAAAQELEKYPVYFDPKLEPDRNPKGAGWEPVGPDRWEEVGSKSYKNDFVNWEKVTISSDSDVRYVKNRCYDMRMDMSKIGTVSSKEHRQSPTILMKDNKCGDKHGFGGDRGTCRKKDITFTVDPYSLRARFRDCGVDMDISKDGGRWHMKYVEVKTPSEHVISDGENVTRYDGELYLYHRGDAEASANILIVGVLLDAQPHHCDNIELEKYIEQWEVIQKAQYDSCGVSFDKKKCSLKAIDADTEASSLTDVIDAKPKMAAKAITKDDNNGSRLLGAASIARASVRGSRSLQPNCTPSRQNDPPPFNPYQFWHRTETKKYYKYDGSLSHPPCKQGVEWRVMRKPLPVSVIQMERINYLISQHLSDKCELGTVGDKRKDGTCHVNVNRPLQFNTKDHDMKDCAKWQ